MLSEQNFICISHLSHAYYMPLSSHLPRHTAFVKLSYICVQNENSLLAKILIAGDKVYARNTLMSERTYKSGPV